VLQAGGASVTDRAAEKGLAGTKRQAITAVKDKMRLRYLQHTLLALTTIPRVQAALQEKEQVHFSKSKGVNFEGKQSAAHVSKYMHGSALYSRLDPQIPDKSR
jgi:hypothetical protein